MIPEHVFIKQTDTRGKNAALIQSYMQAQHKINDKHILNTGAHFQYFTLNGDYAVEPRINYKWKINSLHSISLGFGSHS